MAHKQRGYRFEQNWDPDWARDNAEKTAVGIALPVYEEVKLNNTVLNTESVKRYLVKARKIAIQNCPCRTKFNRCDAPKDVCIQLNDAAERGIARGTSREVTIEEALDAIARAHAAGLVPMAYMRTDTPKPEGVNYICNCCSDCCSILAATIRFGMAPHILKSVATTMTDAFKCISCGACVDRCHFAARKVVDGKLEFNKDLCFGCGLCLSVCPTEAISLIQLI